jgi:hypothetical protein
MTVLLGPVCCEKEEEGIESQHATNTKRFGAVAFTGARGKRDPLSDCKHTLLPSKVDLVMT